MLMDSELENAVGRLAEDGRIEPDLSIVIVSYNTREMTVACIDSVLRETRTPCDILVVDNASDDGSAEAIRSRFPEVRLFAETTNHGFAAAHEIAVKEASAEFLLLLNPDTVVLDGAIDRLMTFAERRPEAGIWGGRTVFGDRSLNPYSCWRRQTLWSLFCAATGLSSLMPRSSLFNPEAYGGWRRDDEREVDIVTGCFLLIRRDLWDRLGGFDPLFFMYGEEADLCLRARAIGARPRITPDAEIVHYGGVSEKVRSDKMVRLLRAKMALVERHFAPAARPLARLLLRAWPWSRMVAARLFVRAHDTPARRTRAAAWSDIWQRRREWWAGYGRGAA